MEPTLYALCIEAGFEIDHHESDLYIKDCQAARTLLNQHGKKIEPFRSEKDGAMWLDVPFAYQPYWDEKTKVGSG
jgi:hypothetical protein